MLADLFKNINSGLEDVLKNAEAGEGTIKDNMDDLCDILEDEILKSKSSEEEKKALLKRLRNFCNTETNIMLVGATGCGKSSTINALFAVGENPEEAAVDDEDVDAEEMVPKKTYVEVAKVGSKADPETKDIEKYRIGNLVLWDTPGLGDGTEIDEHHKEVITELLREEDGDGNALIDLVLVILDGSTRDLGTSYKILKTLYNVCIPMPNGNYQEIDAIIITNRWIHVLECKNRAGYFTGNYNSEIWVQHIGNEENRVKNIYMQNESHIAALEYFLKSKGVIDEWDVYFYNTVLTGGELVLDMGDREERPLNFGFGDYNLVRKSIIELEKEKVERESDFMDKVYMALLPYALFSKNQRGCMQVERERRSKNKEFVRGNYTYYEFPDGVPGLTGDNTLLRQDRVFTQIKIDDNQRNPMWVTIPYLRYEERR